MKRCGLIAKKFKYLDAEYVFTFIFAIKLNGWKKG